MESDNKSISRRGIYLLPSLFTTFGLFAGFFGIISAINGRFEIAAVSIFVAMIMDGLDGRIARMTNTQSDFGAEYDSLADMVSFGMAPALIIFIWNLHTLGKLGWFAAFLYVAAGALRLARFNTQIETASKKHFQGLPSPAAAAVVMGFIWAITDANISDTSIAWLGLCITIFAGLMMISNIRYESFKEINLKGKVPFIVIAAIMLVLAIFSIDPATLTFVGFFGYALSGPAITLWKINQKRTAKKDKPASYTFSKLLSALGKTEQTVGFNDFITEVDNTYAFTPTAFTNGGLHNSAEENNGSCKLFAFAKLHGFSKEETLACFGEHYRDVLSDPEGLSHQNIRNFMAHGWDNIRFCGDALTPKT